MQPLKPLVDLTDTLYNRKEDTQYLQLFDKFTADTTLATLFELLQIFKLSLQESTASSGIYSIFFKDLNLL